LNRREQILRFGQDDRKRARDDRKGARDALADESLAKGENLVEAETSEV